MAMLQAFKTMWIRGFDFKGRSGRSEYWWAFLLNMLISFFLTNVIRIDTIISIYSFVVFVPYLALFIRRLHDSNHSGWNTLFLYVPLTLASYALITASLTKSSSILLGSSLALILGLIYTICLLAKKGDSGLNRFGAPHSTGMDTSETYVNSTNTHDMGSSKFDDNLSKEEKKLMEDKHNDIEDLK